MYPEKKVKMFSYLLMLIMVSSCYSVKPLHKPFDKTISREKPDQVGLILRDDSEVTLHHPKVIDGAIAGNLLLQSKKSTDPDTLLRTIPLDSVKKGYLKMNKMSGTKIIVAVGLTTAIVFILSKNRFSVDKRVTPEIKGPTFD